MRPCEIQAGDAHGDARRSGGENAERTGRERDRQHAKRERTGRERDSMQRERENGKRERESKVMI